MRVLVTRPQNAGRKTAAKLVALGHTPFVVPLAEPKHDQDAAQAALSTRHSAIVVTSAEAARVLRSLGGNLDRHLLTTVFAVGRATARTVMEAGFRTVLAPEGGDGNSLADLIIDHRRDFGVPADPLLYLAGRPRSKTFETRLSAAGVALEIAECYGMEPVRPKRTELNPVFVDEQLDAALFYSRETALLFFDLPVVTEYMDKLERTLFICLSAKVASAIPERFAKSIVVSATPTEEGLLDLL